MGRFVPRVSFVLQALAPRLAPPRKHLAVAFVFLCKVALLTVVLVGSLVLAERSVLRGLALVLQDRRIAMEHASTRKPAVPTVGLVETFVFQDSFVRVGYVRRLVP